MQRARLTAFSIFYCNLYTSNIDYFNRSEVTFDVRTKLQQLAFIDIAFDNCTG
jgi:hypothetical protein